MRSAIFLITVMFCAIATGQTLPDDTNDIKSLTVEQAEALAKATDFRVHLNGLTALSEEAAEALAKRNGDLSLNGLTAISEGVAKALAKNRGPVSLDGLTALSEDAANALANHSGFLSLNGLTAISDEAAKALGRRQGTLSLNGLTVLSDNQVRALSSHSGPVSTKTLNRLRAEEKQRLADLKRIEESEKKTEEQVAAEQEQRARLKEFAKKTFRLKNGTEISGEKILAHNKRCGQAMSDWLESNKKQDPNFEKHIINTITATDVFGVHRKALFELKDDLARLPDQRIAEKMLRLLNDDGFVKTKDLLWETTTLKDQLFPVRNGAEDEYWTFDEIWSEALSTVTAVQHRQAEQREAPRVPLLER